MCSVALLDGGRIGVCKDGDFYSWPDCQIANKATSAVLVLLRVQLLSRKPAVPRFYLGLPLKSGVFIV